MVRKSITSWPQHFHARVKVKGTLADLQPRIPAWIGRLEPLDQGHCLLDVSGDGPEMVAALLLHAGVQVTSIDPPEAAQPIREVAERLLRLIANC
jgi:hypothetical protein